MDMNHQIFQRQFCNGKGMIIEQMHGRLRKNKKQIEKDEGIAKELQDGDQSNYRTKNQNP